MCLAIFLFFFGGGGAHPPRHITVIFIGLSIFIGTPEYWNLYTLFQKLWNPSYAYGKWGFRSYKLWKREPSENRVTSNPNNYQRKPGRSCEYTDLWQEATTKLYKMRKWYIVKYTLYCYHKPTFKVLNTEILSQTLSSKPHRIPSAFMCWNQEILSLVKSVHHTSAFTVVSSS